MLTADFVPDDRAISEGPEGPTPRCRVCGDGDLAPFRVEEAMFRTGEAFDYLFCRGCRSAQIASVPADLARYYDDSYYSFDLDRTWTRRGLRTFPARQALRLYTRVHLRTGRGRWGLPWARAAGIRPHHRVLDLGCGAGSVLMHMHVLGYRRLQGVDPFLPSDTHLPGGVALSRADHTRIEGCFDRIMLHHTLEHVPDPAAVLASCARLLAPGGRILVRMPVMDCYAWRRYGAHWIQLDAPRHLVVPSDGGFRALARTCGFEVIHRHHDSTGFQFWGSELAVSGLPLSEEPADHFDERTLRGWDELAQDLNRNMNGDQAAYVLRRRPAGAPQTGARVSGWSP